MKNKKVIITGGSGFLGTHLVNFLLKKNDLEIIIFDKLDPPSEVLQNKNVYYFKGDILEKEDIIKVFDQYKNIDTVYHLAAGLPNKAMSDELMVKTNIDGTFNFASESVKRKVKSFIFTSSNVAYGIPVELPVNEQTPLKPLEPYGKSKADAEKVLEQFKGKINIQIFRCPVMTGVGRLGLQAILYEFISENKKVYLVGSGANKYQFADADDVCDALEKSSHLNGFEVYAIGADNVMTLRELFDKVIEFAKSKSKTVPLPKNLTLFTLSILDKLNISPLGVYQYTMIGRSIYADTTKIKKKLQWKPKKTNLDTFIDNYKWYIQNKNNFTEIGEGNSSANRSLPKKGILSIVKLFS